MFVLITLDGPTGIYQMRDYRKVTVGLVSVIAFLVVAYGLWRGETTNVVLGVLLIGIIPLVLTSPSR